MAERLIVTKPFLKFIRGDVIADTRRISEILSTEHQKFVTKVASPIQSKG